MLVLATHHGDVLLHPENFSSNANTNSCSTCCSSCSKERHQIRFVQGSTITSFKFLLAAGSLTLPFISEGCFCSHQHAEDGFHSLYDVLSLRPYISLHDAELLYSLAFLLRNRFILTTYMLTPSTGRIVLRVYLIPHDLPGSRGVLRLRDEEKVMKPARTHLRKILSRISKNRALWDGEDVYYDQPVREDCFLPMENDQRSLSQIFNDLTTTHDGSSLPNIPGLRTSLYEYQRESIATMLAMEASNRIANDPLYIPIIGMDARPFYFQPTTMELLLQCPRRYQSRGGILCEELGTGKTVMTLALLLTTLDVLADPPEEDGIEILTPLSFRHFPQESYNALREQALSRKQRRILSSKEKRRTLPSLVEILCDYTRKHPATSNLRVLEDTPLYGHVRKNVPFYFHVNKDFAEATSVRQSKSSLPRLMYLTTATLIVVPATLQAQWYSEILKHCSSAVRILVVKSRKDFPPPVALASDYDIVLTSYHLITFEAAYSKSTLPLDSGYTCSCPEFATSRIPDCSCPPPGDVSPLLRIRWKRLVRDEGHNAAARSTELNHFLRTISAERRWIITGTPTTNLLGLNFGSVTDCDQDLEDLEPVESSAASLIACSHEFSSQEQSEDTSREPSEGDFADSQHSTRKWNKSDRVDLRKLGSMLSDFLGVLPFAVVPDSFSNIVINGLMDESGPLPGTRHVLEQVMAASMVRHRVEDVERYVRLPPLNEEIVLLDLEEYGQMTYNVLLSFIVVNAVDSERRDMDYLFHPSKAAVLATTIENLSHSLFWRFDENAFDHELSDNIHRAENAIIHAQERGQPDEDIQIVQRAISHLRKALENRQYRDMQHGLEVPYLVRNAPLRVELTWGLAHEPEYAIHHAYPFYIYPSYARELRSTVLRQPLINEDSLAVRAELLRAKNKALTEFIEAKKSKADRRSDSKNSSEKRRRRDEVQVDRARLDTARRTGTVDSKEKLQELHEEFRQAQERLKAEAAEDDVDHLGTNSVNSANDGHIILRINLSSARNRLLRGSPYAQMRVGNSTSSKLNYILEEVRKYSATEKFLIFSGQPFNLVHISEGLDLMGVKYLHFMKEVSSTKGKGPQRDQWLTTFETSETYRVFLMELKYGARGLNIVSASRVIFCEPVWRADVESQAIKRVHRIGQTRPVTVKTLAIRSTFEEYMVQRRRDLKGSGSKLPMLAEEWGVRKYLENPVFLETPPQNTVNLDFPLLQIAEKDGPASEHESERVEPVDVMEERPVPNSMGNASVALEEKKVDFPDLCERPSPKRRRVRFS